MNINSGEIWLVPFPYTDISNFKKRPVLIISTSKYNNSQDNILVCQITSKIRGKNSLKIENKNLAEGYLNQDCEVRFYNIANLHKDLFLHKIGHLYEKTLNNCKKEFSNFIEKNCF